MSSTTRDNKKILENNPHIKDYINSLKKWKNDQKITNEVENENNIIKTPLSSSSPTNTTSNINTNIPSNLDNTSESIKYKEKGNQSFQQNQFKEAIEYYSMAIKFDSTNSVLYSNRALAYIKIKNYSQAEVDCNRCLNLDPRNMKAFHRRGQSRIELKKYDEAISDFKFVLLNDPNNKDTLAELNKVNILKSIEPHTPSPIPPSPTSLSESTNNNNNSSIPKPSNLKINSPTSQTTSIIPNIEQKTVISPKIIQMESTTTVTTTNSPTSSINSPTSISTNDKSKTSSLEERLNRVSQIKAPIPKQVPKNSFEFERVYLSFQGDNELFYQYFKLIEPTQLARIIDETMTPQLFASILKILEHNYLANQEYELIYQILLNLLNVRRMSINIPCLSHDEKKSLKMLISSLYDCYSLKTHDITNLISKYNV